MGKIISIALFFMILITLLADPAPVSIEFADIILIVLPLFLGFISIICMKSKTIHKNETRILIAVLFYLGYLLNSTLTGLMSGVPILKTLRSLGPYIDFFPLVFLGLLPARLLKPWFIASILVFVGGLQAGYQIYLYFTHSYGGSGTMDVLRSRITLIEPRTTLPIILGITVLPMVLLSYKNKFWKITAYACLLTGLFAGAATLTRSIVISMLIGWLAFIILYAYKQSFLAKFSFATLTKKFFIYLFFLLGFIVLISLIPKIHALEQGLIARFSMQNTSAASVDYSNGRLYDEWLPAIMTWMNSGIYSLFFGIGVGNHFFVATGEERTYIHNILIYNLVYGGFFGLLACLWLYFTIFRVLISRALQTQQTIYLGFAALLVSMFTYAQLFAVHKGLAFNAMLFLMIAVALSQPAVQSNVKGST
jgi:hypothetical protein